MSKRCGKKFSKYFSTFPLINGEFLPEMFGHFEIVFKNELYLFKQLEE